LKAADGAHGQLSVSSARQRLHRALRPAPWARGLAGVLCALAGLAAAADDDVSAPWRERFAQEVDRRLEVPASVQQRYAELLNTALTEAALPDLPPQAVVLVDRSVNVQAAFVLLRTPERSWPWLGAAPVSTGRTGSFDRFLTPLG
jgi:hypothetical protein